MKEQGAPKHGLYTIGFSAKQQCVAISRGFSKPSCDVSEQEADRARVLRTIGDLRDRIAVLRRRRLIGDGPAISAPANEHLDLCDGCSMH